MSLCIVYLASPRSHHIYNDPSQASRLQVLHGSLQIARGMFPSVDIFVFHEDYTEKEFISLPEVTKFIQVDFTGHEEHYNPSLRRPYGYMMMCRFFSGVMQSHPELSPYTHYMRLDDDSYFQTPYLQITPDTFNHDYIYRSTFGDAQDQQSLWEFTVEFLRKEGYAKHIDTLKKELRKKYFLRDDTYTGMAPYNNFHIASQKLWQNPLIQRYIQAIESCHGILRYGWMDANVHAMITRVLTLFIGMDIHVDTSFGYRHNRHVSRMGDVGVDHYEHLPFTAYRDVPSLTPVDETKSSAPTQEHSSHTTDPRLEDLPLPDDSILD